MADGDRSRRVEVGPSDARALDVYDHGRIGRPPTHKPEVVETVLWEVAIEGGNVARAMRNLRQHRDDIVAARAEAALEGIEVQGDEPPELPREETVRRWVKTQYRNRYHEILSTRHRQLEELVAGQATERALAADEIKRDAMRQIQAGMSNLDAVEASNVLRNVAAAQKQDVDNALAIRRQGQLAQDSRSLSIIADGLVKLGVASYRAGDDDVVDGEVVGEGEGDPSLPAAD